MKLKDYIKDKLFFIILNLILFLIISLIMSISKVPIIIIFLIFIVWFIPLISYILIEFIKYKNYYSELIDISKNLDKIYLISEIIKEATFIEGKIINDILKDINKNMQKEYREYIETWAHEIKTQ